MAGMALVSRSFEAIQTCLGSPSGCHLSNFWAAACTASIAQSDASSRQLAAGCARNAAVSPDRTLSGFHPLGILAIIVISPPLSSASFLNALFRLRALG